MALSGRLWAVKLIEVMLAVVVVLGLTAFAYQAVGEFPLNAFVAALAFVVAAALMLQVRRS